MLGVTKEQCDLAGCKVFSCSALCSQPASNARSPYDEPVGFETYEPPSVPIGERTGPQKPHGTIKKLECVFKNCRAPIVVFKSRDEVLFGCQHGYHVLNEIQVMQAQGDFVREEKEWRVTHGNVSFMTDADSVFIKDGDTVSEISRDGVHPTSIGASHIRKEHQKFLRYLAPQKSPIEKFFDSLQEIFRALVRAIEFLADKSIHVGKKITSHSRKFAGRGFSRMRDARRRRRVERDRRQDTRNSPVRSPEEEELDRETRRLQRVRRLAQAEAFFVLLGTSYFIMIVLSQTLK